MNEKPESWLNEENPRAGVLTEPPGAPNELHEVIRMLFCPT